MAAPLLSQAIPQEALDLVCNSADVKAAEADLPKHFELLAAPSLSPDSQTGAISPRGVIQRSWTLVLANSSSLTGYKFPVALQLGSSATAPKCNENRDLNLFMKSTLALQYVPLIVQRPQGQTTGISTTSDRKGSATYTLPLLGVGTVEDAASAIDQEIRKRLQALIDSFPDPKTAPFTEAEKNQILNLAKEARAAAFSRLSLNAVLAYNWDTRSNMPNSANLAFNGTKALSVIDAKTPDKPDWILNGTAAGTWFGRAGAVGAYSKLTASAGLDRSLPQQFVVSVLPSWDRYEGSAFPGIMGLSDRRRRDDFSIKEALTLKVAGSNQIAFSISEVHVGTRDHDVAVGVNFNYKLPLSSQPKPAAGGM
jgi:hypothetical protein